MTNMVVNNTASHRSNGDYEKTQIEKNFACIIPFSNNKHGFAYAIPLSTSLLQFCPLSLFESGKKVHWQYTVISQLSFILTTSQQLA